MIRLSAHTLRNLAARSSSTAVPPIQQAAAYFSTETVLKPVQVSFKEADDKLRERRKNSNKEDISQEEMADRNRVMEASRRGQMEAPATHKPIPTPSRPPTEGSQFSTADILHSNEDGGGGVYQPGMRTPKDTDDILRESKGGEKSFIRPPDKAVPGNKGERNWPQSALDQKMQEKRDKDQQDLMAKAATLVETARQKATPELTEESKQILKEAAQESKVRSKEFAEHPIESLGSSMKTAAAASKDFFEDATKSSKESFENVKELAEELGHTKAGEKVKETADKATEMTGLKLTDESKDIIKEAVQDTKAKGKEFVEHPIETMQSEMERAKAKGEKVFVDAKEETKEKAEEVKEATGALKEKMPDSTESLKETAEETKKQAVKTAEAKKEALKEKVPSSTESLKETAEEKGKQAMKTAEAKKEEMASTVKEKGQKMAGNFQDKAKKTAEQAKVEGKEAFRQAQENAKDKTEEAKEKSKEMLGKAQENAKQVAAKTKDQAMDTASSMWEKAKQMVSGGDGK